MVNLALEYDGDDVTSFSYASFFYSFPDLTLQPRSDVFRMFRTLTT